MSKSLVPSMKSWLRLPLFSLLAGVVTVGLFVLMGKMIANEAIAAPAPTTVYTGLGEADYPEESPPRKPEKYEEPDLPTRPQLPGDTSTDDTLPEPSIPPMPDIRAPTGVGGFPGGDGAKDVLRQRPDTTPFPPYPGNAQRNGIEGYVVVELTVDSRGRVLEAKIVSSTPPRVFDDATLRAVQRWSLPSAAPQHGQATVRRRLDFTLQQ